MKANRGKHCALFAACVFAATAGIPYQTALAQPSSAADADKARARQAALLWYFPRSFRYDVHMVSQVAFSPDGKVLAAISSDILDDAIRLFDVEADKEQIRFGGPRRGYSCILFTADSNTLFTAGLDRGQEAYVFLRWSPATGRETLRFQATLAEALSIHLIESEKTLVSIHLDGTLRFWDLATGKEKRSWKPPAAKFTPMVLAPDGRTVALVREHQVVELWDVERGLRVRQLTQSPPKYWAVDRLAFSPDGRLLACAVDQGKSIQLLDTATGLVKREIPQKPLRGGRWSPMAFSPDNTMLALHDGESGVVWDIANGKELLRDGISWRYTVAFSRDGKRLATGPGKTASLNLWELPR
jgi:WD40 repeat protein